MEKDTYRSQFRMPQQLFEKLKAAADQNKRSVNAELVARLEASFLEVDGAAEAALRRTELRALIIEEVENYLHPPYVDTTRKA
jgi:hypothetical protein